MAPRPPIVGAYQNRGAIGVATTTNGGLMSAADKAHLDALPASVVAATSLRSTTGAPTVLASDQVGDFAVDVSARILYGPFPSGGPWPAGVPLSTFGATTAVTTTATLSGLSQVVLASSAGGAYTITLGTGAKGQEVLIKKTTSDANKITLAGSIEGAGTSAALFSLNDRYRFVWDDVNSTWRIAEKLLAPQVFTASGSWICPAGVSLVDFDVLASGGGGGGGGSALTSGGVATQVGGSGGGCGARMRRKLAVTPGATYTVTVGAVAVGGGGGALNGNAASAAGSGNLSAVSGTGVAISAPGGTRGQAGGANSTANVAAGIKGAGVAAATTTINSLPGGGGVASPTSGGGGGYDDYGFTGGAGTPASATLGGLAGNLTGAFQGNSSFNGTAQGVDAADQPVNTGLGGAGGGGGAPGARGGNGGAAGSGQVVITVLA